MMNFILPLQEHIQTKQGIRIGMLINILLIILLITSLYQIFGLFKSHPVEPLQFTPLKPITIPDIASWHLFGFDQTNTSELEGLPNVSAQLQLIGVFVTEPADQSYALIVGEDGKEHTYKIGDIISDQIKISQILADHVVLQDHDHLASLSLPTKPLRFGEMPEQLEMSDNH